LADGFVFAFAVSIRTVARVDPWNGALIVALSLKACSDGFDAVAHGYGIYGQKHGAVIGVPSPKRRLIVLSMGEA
jgi:hypothetical protein